MARLWTRAAIGSTVRARKRPAENYSSRIPINLCAAGVDERGMRLAHKHSGFVALAALDAEAVVPAPVPARTTAVDASPEADKPRPAGLRRFAAALRREPRS
jgi:hypothetical protein